MKIKRYLNLLAVMSVFAACQNETDIFDAPLKGTEVTIEAAREGAAGSRTTLTEEYKINWHESDKLSVFLGATVNQPFTIHEGAGTDYATFKGTGDIYITGGSESSAGTFANVAYYPYSEGVQVAQGANGAYTITASLPSTQTYRQGSFGQDAYHMVAVAESNRDYAFTFKNVGSMFMLYLKGTAEITKIELESQANKLAGACTVTAAYGEEPSVVLDANSAESKITLNCMSEVEGGVTKGVQLSETESTVFVIAVPPIAGNADDLTFTIYDANHGYMVYKNAAAYSVARNQYYTFGATTAVEYKATDYDFADDVVAWIGNNTFTSISSAVAASQANDVINVKPGTYTEVVDVTGGKNVTIQPANEGDEVTIAGIAHESNGTPSTIVVKNITLDNTLQTEGWFTGTGNNLKPCVGAWGGNLTFNNCKFIVSGESTAETGVMTWWTGGIDMTLKFAGCAFDGKDNHASARAMQIYGDVDLTVENCTFNTYKDYSLKYVGGEGHTATFSNNKVYNTKYFVELGSSAYPGKNCTVYFNESTLGDGIGNYLVANDEGQTIYLDGALAVADAAGLYKLAETATGDVKIMLVDNITLGNETERCMAVNFKNVTKLTIEGNDKTLTLKGKDASGSGSVGDEYVAGILAAGANVTIKNLTIVNDKLSNKGTETSAGRNTVYSFVRGETVTYEDVAFDGGVQVEGNETFRGCSFTETVLTTDADGYAKDGRFCMFIDHQYDTTGTYVVTLEDCTFDASGYGCVKVAGDKGANITVNVKDCTFTNICPSNSWSKDTPKYDIKTTGANITVNDQGENDWSDGANAGFGKG